MGTLLDVTFDRGVSGRIYRVHDHRQRPYGHVSGQVFKIVYDHHRVSAVQLQSTMFYFQRAN